MNDNDIFVIHPFLKFSKYKQKYYLEEAKNLVKAIDLRCRKSFTIGLEKISPKTFINKGNILYFKKQIKESSVDVVFLNVNLTPIQQRNLENELNAKVIDRTGLILEIFGSRANSNEGKLSVELASLQFQKSRLVRSWTHLERQRGGAGFMGGPGEKQIESDKRQITEQINRLKKKIKNISSIRNIQRYRRKKNKIPVISLIGYTNSGKSTLFNKLTKSNVLSKNMLFASLDSTIRKSFFNDINVLFVDTVGFIRDLPTTLIDAFKSTLDEIINSDLILHVRDISDTQYLIHKKEVLKILQDIGVYKDDNRIIEVINKIDTVADIKNFHNQMNKNSIMISAKNKTGINLLMRTIKDKLKINEETNFLFQ